MRLENYLADSSEKNYMMQETRVDFLSFQIYGTKDSIGEAAAGFVTKQLKDIKEENRQANLLLATGASQLEFLKTFMQLDQLDWPKIASFRKYLYERIIDIMQPREAYFLKGDADNISEELERYENLLRDHPIDVAYIGIGENDHLAFNDPEVADFEDPQLLKIAKT